MTFRSAFALAFLLVTTMVVRADTPPTAAGFWEVKDDDGNPTAWFLFTEKNDVFSARLVKGFKKPSEMKPADNICSKCPGNKKGAHIMGLTLFYGMKRDGLQYREGSVLDPRDGSIYHAQMDLSDDGEELSVRGYIGIPMLGKTQVWHRLPDDAMKKEEIPKEILANGVAADSASGDKPKSHDASTAAADKKSHKSKSDKSKPAAEKPEAEPDSANSDKPGQ
jgi:hypothetical protein